MKFLLQLLCLFMALFGVAHAEDALGPDFSALTGAISFTTAGTAVLAGYLLLAKFGLVVKGGRAILKAIGLKV